MTEKNWFCTEKKEVRLFSIYSNLSRFGHWSDLFWVFTGGFQTGIDVLVDVVDLLCDHCEELLDVGKGRLEMGNSSFEF